MPDDEHLLDDQAAELDEADRADDAGGDETFLDRLRGGGVGTEDENLVGDVGPTDIPPGTDGDALRLATSDEPVDHLEV